MAEYRIFTRLPNLQKEREIMNFTSLTMISKFNHAGKWTMSGEGENPFSAHRGIVVERDGVNIFSGVVTRSQSEKNAADFISKKWTENGIDDLARLNRRYAYPDPINLTITSQTHDTRSGAAETVILGYVEANGGETAHPDRRFAQFMTAVDLGRGLSVRENARFQPLLDLIHDLAARGGVGFRVRYDAELGKLVFEVFEPVNRSADVRFSMEFGNLSSFMRVREVPKANAVVLLGQGEGIDRAMVTVEDSDSISQWERIETVKDQRNESDNTALPALAEAELQSGKEVNGFSLTPIQIGNIGFQYGVDYCLGDFVTVVDEDTALIETVTGVQIDINEIGVETIKPSIGKVETIPLSRTFDKINDLEERVSQIETSQ